VAGRLLITGDMSNAIRLFRRPMRPIRNIMPLFVSAWAGAGLAGGCEEETADVFQNDTSVTAVIFEAETMAVTPTSAATISSDSTASAGQKLALWSNAQAQKTFSLASAVDQLVVRARGDQCSGAPQMVVTVDGVQVLSTSVAATTWTDYRIAQPLSASTHAMVIAFTNDYRTSSCDRNLHLDVVSSVTASSTLEAETMTGGGAVFNDSTASAGQALVFWSNGTASRQVTTPAFDSMVVRARGDQCSGAPHLVLSVDGTQALSTSVAAASWTDYTANVSLPSGAHTFQLTFDNDYRAAGGCDRNLRVDELTFAGTTSCTPTTCAAQGTDCGSISDGCGGTLTCGGCSLPDTCSGGGTPNVCGNVSSAGYGAGSAPIGTACTDTAHTVTPSMSTSQIQSVISNAPTGAYICFASGTYRLTATLSPRQSQTMHGEPGAVLKGSVVLSGFTPSGNTWVVGSVPLITTGPEAAAIRWCEDNVGGPCAYAEDVFFDGAPLTRVLSASAVTAGTFYTDYTNDNVYIGSDPSGHTVEIGHTTAAIRSTQASVVIEGFIVEMFAHLMDRGGIEVTTGVTGNIIRNCESRYNHGLGIASWGAGTQIIYNRLHDNGQLGVGAGQQPSGGVLIDHNDVIHNNIDGFWRIDGASGGIKLDLENYGTVTNNLVRDNLSLGIWYDDNSNNGTITGNYVDHNWSSGIEFEISSNAMIANNTVINNGLGEPMSRGHIGCKGLGCAAGIMINTSAGVEISGNTITGNLSSISLVSDTRTPRTSAITIPSLVNANVHDNTVTLGSGLIGLLDWGPTGFDPYSSGSNNQLTHNTYHLNSLTETQFYWQNAAIAKPQWQADGQDTTGTFLVP
jgi:parallel beta-helix repeat protein